MANYLYVVCTNFSNYFSVFSVVGTVIAPNREKALSLHMQGDRCLEAIREGYILNNSDILLVDERDLAEVLESQGAKIKW